MLTLWICFIFLYQTFFLQKIFLYEPPERRLLKTSKLARLLVLSSRRSDGFSLGFRAGSQLARSKQND